MVVRWADLALYSSIFMVIRWADLALYSSIFMVIRWADPVSVFFDTYRNILYQSDISGQDAQSASIPRMFFLSAGSVSQRKVASGRAAAEEG